MAEAETEIMAGTYIEYSGAGLAIYRLTKSMSLFVLPMFLVVIFMGGIIFSGWSVLWGILKYIGLLVLITLIRNTNPRIRVDQAVRFFWAPVTILAVLAVILAILGK
jgi:NADH-quinone oxidoreductase subunit H